MLTSPPSRVTDVAYGKALVAVKDLPEQSLPALKDLVTCPLFIRVVVSYNDLSDYDKCYVLNFLPKGEKEWKWLLPQSDARYANHSCDPNSMINENLEIVTMKSIKEGEQITFCYNIGEETDEWDPIWSFECCCGAKNCQKQIDRYRPKSF